MRANIAAFRGDPDRPLLLSLEHYDEDAKTAKKTAIFRERTIQFQKPVESVGSAKEALLVSLNQRGRVDLDHIAGLLARPAQEFLAELNGLIFLNPQTNGGIAVGAPLGGIGDRITRRPIGAHDPGADGGGVADGNSVVSDPLPSDVLPKKPASLPWVATLVLSWMLNQPQDSIDHVHTIYIVLAYAILEENEVSDHRSEPT